MTLRLFMLSPEIVFKARVNMASTVYPLKNITYDTVTVGAYTDLLPGMTLVLGSIDGYGNRGRQRVRAGSTGTNISVGMSSRGVHDGELDTIDDSYITVWDDYRVWARIPYIEPGGKIYKDGTIEVGNYTLLSPPVANTGPPAAGTVNLAGGKLRVALPPVSNNSFATQQGATIASYLWTIPAGVALVGGSLATDAQILVDADPGFHWIVLQVTDSNGQTHQARTFIYARDPSADTTISNFEIVNHRIAPEGQTLGVRILEDIPGITYPDGTLVILMDGEPESLAVRENILFWGWHQEDQLDIEAVRTGTMAGTILNCVDAAGRLESLPGFSTMIYNNANRDITKNPTITWAFMDTPNWDKLIAYLLRWHSTVLEVTDYTDSGTGDTYAFTFREAGGMSLFDQINNQAMAMCPGRVFTCDKFGRLAIKSDPMLQNVADRTNVVQDSISVSDWSQIRYTYRRPPRYHWLEDSAILTGWVASGLDVDTVFSHSPGDIPGQGEGIQVHGEQIVPSQEILNAATGQRYARLNAREGLYQIALANDQNPSIDPAAMTWCTLTIPESVAAQRGVFFTAERGLVHEMVIRYDHGRGGVTRSVDILWEREIYGPPATTVIHEVSLPVGEQPIIVPEPDPVDIWSSPAKAYVAWDSEHIVRTGDLLVASPTWELVDTGITGVVWDMQYVHLTSTNTVGAWAMTTDGIFWCADLLAATPSWTNVLPIATIRATDETPAGTSTVRCMAMFNYASEPGYLIVATGPGGGTVSDLYAYAHSYTWHTHDYGANWTQVDMNEFTSGGRYYHGCHIHGINIFRSSPGTIWCVRATPGALQPSAVFVSVDLGHTWTMEKTFPNDANNWYGGSILNPFPSIDDPSYIVSSASDGVVDVGNLYISTDAWDTGTELTVYDTPTGYQGVAPFYRVNKRTYDNTHVIAWFKVTAGNYHLLQSLDAGASWSLLWDSAEAQAGVQFPMASRNSSRLQTPNGWPPEIDMWAVVRTYSAAGAVANAILYTDDNFATVQDKTGNLSAILATWTSGPNNGFWLPKVGTNA